MLITILAGAFILSVVIIVHEFGHFIVAKKLGIYVKVFSVGFGKKILKKRFGETVYALSMLPFGGYVKFAGETEGEKAEKDVPDDDDAPERKSQDETPDSEIDPSRYFVSKSPYRRGAVVFAGPFFNYLLAIVVYMGMFAIHGVSTIPDTQVGEIVPGSTADSVGLRLDDRITAINGETVADWDALVNKLVEAELNAQTLTVDRGGEVISIEYRLSMLDGGYKMGFYPHVSPRVGQVKFDAPAYKAGIRTGHEITSINDTLITSYYDIERIIHANPEVPLYIGWNDGTVQHVDSITPQSKKVLKENSKTEFKIVGQIGIGPFYETRRVPVHNAFMMAVKSSNGMIVEILSFLKLMFTGQAGLDAVGGPIMITQMAGDMARWGFNYLLYFLAFFSVNLCIFNLLPILPFDGGHLTLFTWEAVTRRKVNRRLREVLAQAGFVLLILLMVFVVLVDVSRCTGSSPTVF